MSGAAARALRTHVLRVETDQDQCAKCGRPLYGEAAVRSRNGVFGDGTPRCCSGLCAWDKIYYHSHTGESKPRAARQWTFAKWAPESLGSEKIPLENAYDRRWYRQHMKGVPP